MSSEKFKPSRKKEDTPTFSESEGEVNGDLLSESDELQLNKELAADISGHKTAIDTINSNVQKSEGIKRPMEEIDAEVLEHEEVIHTAENKILTDSLNNEINEHKVAIDTINRSVQSEGIKHSTEEIEAEVLEHEKAIHEAEEKINTIHKGEKKTVESGDNETDISSVERAYGPDSFEALSVKRNAEEVAVLNALENRSEELDTEAEKVGFNKETFRKMGEWWSKKPAWVRIGAGVGLVAASALVGGPVGSALYIGATAGRGILTAASTFYTTEKFLSNSLKKKEKWWNKYPTGTATILGILVGFGASHLLSGFDGSGEAVSAVNTDASGLIMNSGSNLGELTTIYEAHTVVGGDTMWKIIENHPALENTLQGLSPEQQTYVIDGIKDKLQTMTPEELKDIGIDSGNINLINPGEKIDLSTLFDSQSDMNAVAHLQENALNLTPDELTNIKDYQEAIELTPVEITQEQVTTVMNQEINNRFANDGLFGSGFGAQSGLESELWNNFHSERVNDILNTQPTDIDMNENSLVGSGQDLETLQTYLKEVESNIGIANQNETVEDYIQRGVEYGLHNK